MLSQCLKLRNNAGKIYYVSMCYFCIQPNNANVHIKHVGLISQLTGKSEVKVFKTIKYDPVLQSMTDEEIKQLFLSLQSMADDTGLDWLHFAKNKNLNLLTQRIEQLKEFGLYSDAIKKHVINKFMQIIRKPISHLKEKALIPNKLNVATHLAQQLNINSSYCLNNLNDDYSLIEIKQIITKQYLKEKLNMTDEMFDKKRIKHFNNLKHKSLSTIKENMNLSLNILKQSRNRLQNNLFILYGNPENKIKLINEIPSIAGVDIKLILRTFPLLQMYPAQNFIDIHQLLKEYNISDEAIKRCLEIFTFNPCILKTRLDYMRGNKKFSVFLKHSRILALITYAKHVIKNIDKVDDALIGVSLNRLKKNEDKFNHFIEFGPEGSVGHHIISYIQSELNCDKDSLTKELKKHPYWTYGVLWQMQEILELLRENDFTDTEIKEDIHILLYSKDVVKKELDELSFHEGLDECRDENGNIRRELRLRLIIYFIEKINNFTGNAIWGNNFVPHNNE